MSNTLLLFAQDLSLLQQSNSDEIDTGRAYYSDNDFLVLEGTNIAVSVPSSSSDGKYQQAGINALFRVEPLNEYAFFPDGAQYRGLLLNDGNAHIIVCLIAQRGINRVVVLKNGEPISTDVEGNRIDWNRKFINPAESYGFQIEVDETSLIVYSIKDAQAPAWVGEFNVSLNDFTISLMLQSVSSLAQAPSVQMKADRIEIQSPQLRKDTSVKNWKTISQ